MAEEEGMAAHDTLRGGAPRDTSVAEQGAKAAEEEAVAASGGAEASSSQEWSTMLLLDAFANLSCPQARSGACAAPAGPHHQPERERARERKHV